MAPIVLFVRIGALLSDRIGPIHPAASVLSIRPLRAYLFRRFGLSIEVVFLEMTA